jgi:hypothetical protein
MLTSEDGTTVYSERLDVNPIIDPLLGNDPYPGEYTVWHKPPTITLRPDSRLKEGQRILASYYHPAVIYSHQVSCCMSEPELYDILAWQLDNVREALAPDGYMMMHDEIRAQGWDSTCVARKLTCSEILASCVRRCVALIHKADPGKPLYVWSDMFDPTHNARDREAYYLVKGNGPWHGAWQALPSSVTIINWQMDPASRKESLAHFASRGHHQILAGYYDGNPISITGWLRDASKVKGIDGVMYTTWQGNFNHTDAFIKATDTP